MIFLSELSNIQTMVRPEWVILGDFNMIRRAREKQRVNQQKGDEAVR
jgi:hypothetical protein